MQIAESSRRCIDCNWWQRDNASQFLHSAYVKITHNVHEGFQSPFQSMHGITNAVHAKRKPPCIGGMELVSLSCNRVFISAESVGRGWCKIAIATKWYQFHATDKCGFLFMPWITDQYIFVQYTKLVNKTGTAVAKVITFSIMTT